MHGVPAFPGGEKGLLPTPSGEPDQSLNANAVHPPAGDSCFEGGSCSFGFFCFPAFFLPLAFSQLIRGARSLPSGSVLFTFTIGSPRVPSFMRTNRSGTSMVCARRGHGRAHGAQLPSQKQLGLGSPHSRPTLDLFFFWCEDISARSSSPRSGYSARAASPSPAGSKAACSRRTQQCDLHSWPPRKAEGDPRGGWCHFSAVSLLQGRVTPAGHGGGPGSMRPRRWGP